MFPALILSFITFRKWLWSVFFTKHTKALLSKGTLILWPWTCPHSFLPSPAQKNIGSWWTFPQGHTLFFSGTLKSMMVDCHPVLTQKSHTCRGNNCVWCVTPMEKWVLFYVIPNFVMLFLMLIKHPIVYFIHISEKSCNLLALFIFTFGW